MIFQPKNDGFISDHRLMVSVAVITLMAAAAVFVGWRGEALGRGLVTIGGSDRVSVEIASTDSAREKGLSGRDGLAPDSGMLFIFQQPAIYTFWMKDMRFPIDILWIRQGQIVDMSVNAPVPVSGQAMSIYSPQSPADEVLELPAGYAAAHGLRTGLPVAVRIDSGPAAR